MGGLTRRQLLTATAASGLAAATACGSDDTARTATTRANPEFSLVAVFPAGEPYLAATHPQRMAFIIAGKDGAPLDTISGNLKVTLSSDGKQLGAPLEVAPHGAGLARSYLPVPLMAERPGIVDVRTSYRGVPIEASVQVWDPAKVRYPQIGRPIPSVVTPTVADHGGVEPICTADPPCGFHQHSLADSLAAHRPIALLVSTPAYCQTAICGPMLDVLTAQSPGREGIDFIHAEVYSNPTKVPAIADAEQSPIVKAFSMLFEPALFLIDHTGTLVGRLDSIFDRDELVAGLDSLS